MGAACPRKSGRGGHLCHLLWSADICIYIERGHIVNVRGIVVQDQGVTWLCSPCVLEADACTVLLVGGVDKRYHM